MPIGGAPYLGTDGGEGGGGPMFVTSASVQCWIMHNKSGRVGAQSEVEVLPMLCFGHWNLDSLRLLMRPSGSDFGSSRVA